VVLEGEAIEFAAPQLGTDHPAPGGAMEVEAQDLRLGPLPVPHLPGLLPFHRAAVPALDLDEIWAA